MLQIIEKRRQEDYLEETYESKPDGMEEKIRKILLQTGPLIRERRNQVTVFLNKQGVTTSSIHWDCIFFKKTIKEVRRREWLESCYEKGTATVNKKAIARMLKRYGILKQIQIPD